MTLSAIILAAGKATRMKSERVKVLHEICGRPMLSYVLDACRAVGVTRLFVVVGYDKERVIETFKADKDIIWVVQAEQKGTGHAPLMCKDAFTQQGLLKSSPAAADSHCFLLCGDGPLIREHTLRQLLGKHRHDQAALTLATCELADPTGYGRIVRAGGVGGGKHGQVLGIVEQKDATPEQRLIREVNPSYYLFQTAAMFPLLEQIQPSSKTGEYYVTETVQLGLAEHQTVSALCAVPPEDVLSINSRAELAQVNHLMQERIQKEIMNSGVTLVSPAQTWIEFGVKIGQDTVLEPFTWVGQGAIVGSRLRIKAGTVIPAGTRIES